MLKWAQRSQERVEHAPGRWAGIALGTALVLLGLGNAGRIAHWLHEKRLRAHPERSPDQAAAMWYERMTRVLARRGVQKSSAQTPQEFVRVIPGEPLREKVQQFTEAYESARFGLSQEAVQRLPELYQKVETTTHK
jgi:hypothetical protein